MSNWIDASLDELRIYDSALSDEQIYNLYLENSLSRCGDLVCDGDETKANCCIDCCGAVGQTLSDIGSGLGSLFSMIAIPIVIFSVLLGIGYSVAILLSSISRRIGAKV